MAVWFQRILASVGFRQHNGADGVSSAPVVAPMQSWKVDQTVVALDFSDRRVDCRIPLPPGSEEGPAFRELPDRQSLETSLRLEIGERYFSIATDEDISWYLLDERECRKMSRRDGSCQIDSLFSYVSFRVDERLNRDQLEPLFVKVWNGAISHGDFAIESELGIQVPKREGESPPEVVEIVTNRRIEYRNAGINWAEVDLSDTTIAPALNRGWNGFLRHTCQIHPAISRRIGALDEFPRCLTFRTRRPPREYERRLELTSVQFLPAQERTPPPASWHMRKLPNDRLSKLLQSLELRTPTTFAVADRAVHAFVRQAVASGRGIDGMLATMELLWHTGEQKRIEPLFAMLRNVVGRDPQANAFQRHWVARTPEDSKQAIQFIESLDRSQLTKAYALDVLHANLLQNTGELTEVETLFQNALEANPELAGVWCDLGKHYHSNYKHVEAWQCYAAARFIAPRHFLLEEILDLETKLRLDFSDYL